MSSASGSARRASRVILIVTAAFALWRAVRAAHWLGLWVRTRRGDPSAAELYEVDFWFEVIRIIAVVALGGLLTLLVRWWRR